MEQEKSPTRVDLTSQQSLKKDPCRNYFGGTLPGIPLKFPFKKDVSFPPPPRMRKEFFCPFAKNAKPSSPGKLSQRVRIK
eukprot:scaffold131_cov125-Cylindrotheca_fusiformis.AAC.2